MSLWEVSDSLGKADYVESSIYLRLTVHVGWLDSSEATRSPLSSVVMFVSGMFWSVCA